MRLNGVTAAIRLAFVPDAFDRWVNYVDGIFADRKHFMEWVRND